MPLSNWQGSYNGLTFGGAGNNVGVVSVKGWEDMPDIRAGDMPYPRDAGALAGLDLPGERVIDIEYEIVASAGQQLTAQMDIVKTAFMTQRDTMPPLTLQLPGQVARLSNCRPRKRSSIIDIEYVGGLGKMLVQFVAPDPIIYSEAVHSLVTTLPTPSSGVTFPATFPLTFGGTVGGGGTISCVNAGNYPTKGVATITGPCINPRVQNSSTNKTVAVNLTLGVSDVLEIDFAAHTVILNTNGYRYSAVTTAQWWTLAASSTTTVAFYSSDPSPTAATMTFTWSDAWL